MAGPVAMSKPIDAYRPIITVITETTIEPKIILKGDLEKTLAIAGGIISKEVISNTPTIRTETVTARAIKNINNNS